MLSWLSKLVNTQQEAMCAMWLYKGAVYIQAYSRDVDGIWSSESHPVYACQFTEKHNVYKFMCDALSDSKTNITRIPNPEGLKMLLEKTGFKRERELVKKTKSITVDFNDGGFTLEPSAFNGHYLETISEKEIVLHNPTEEEFLGAIDQAFEACG